MHSIGLVHYTTLSIIIQCQLNNVLFLVTVTFNHVDVSKLVEALVNTLLFTNAVPLWLVLTALLKASYTKLCIIY